MKKIAVKSNRTTLLPPLVAVLTAMIAVPRINLSTTTAKGAQALAKKIVTDLRRTRRLAISDAASNASGYRIQMNGPGPYADYDIVNLNTSATVDSHTIDSEISCTNGAAFSFGPMGNLLAGSDSQIDITGADADYTLTITSATGMVKCVEN